MTMNSLKGVVEVLLKTVKSYGNHSVLRVHAYVHARTFALNFLYEYFQDMEFHKFASTSVCSTCTGALYSLEIAGECPIRQSEEHVGGSGNLPWKAKASVKLDAIIRSLELPLIAMEQVDWNLNWLAYYFPFRLAIWASCAMCLLFPIYIYILTQMKRNSIAKKKYVPASYKWLGRERTNPTQNNTKTRHDLRQRAASKHSAASRGPYGPLVACHFKPRCCPGSPGCTSW